MKSVIKHLFLVFVLTVLTVSSANAYELISNVTYNSRTGMKADIYRTPGDYGRPTVVYFHSGGFQIGSKTDPIELTTIQQLARIGFNVVAVNYRLVSQGHYFPAQIQDADCALRWLRRYGPTYSLSNEDVYLFGHSSGGLLAQNIHLEPGKYTNSYSCDHYYYSMPYIDGLILATAPTDLTDENSNSVWLIDAWMNGQDPTLASPIHILERVQPSTSVPWHYVHGTDDPVVPIPPVQKMVSDLNKKGVPAQLDDFLGEKHGLATVTATQYVNPDGVHFAKALGAARDMAGVRASFQCVNPVYYAKDPNHTEHVLHPVEHAVDNINATFFSSEKYRSSTPVPGAMFHAWFSGNVIDEIQLDARPGNYGFPILYDIYLTDERNTPGVWKRIGSFSTTPSAAGGIAHVRLPEAYWAYGFGIRPRKVLPDQLGDYYLQFEEVDVGDQ